MEYLYPISIFLGLALVSGILLTVASKLLAVKADERVESITQILPNANCGACGYAGCADYAGAIVNSDAKLNLCKPGGAEVCEKISKIVGGGDVVFVPEAAVVHCSGSSENTALLFQFEGIQTCAAAKRFFGGSSSCSFGCAGLGDCVKVCDKGAIKIIGGIAVIDKKLCAACGLCVAACPAKLISLQPTTKHYSVLCSSCDAGKTTRLSCKRGCIGCKICEKKCVSGAIKVENNHAVIDYTKCISCGQCFEACPTGAIICCEKQNF